MHIDLPGVIRIVKKLGVDFVEVIGGFEKGGGGRSYPVKSGILTFKENRTKILEEYAKRKLELERREAKKRQQEARNTWKQLIKKILTRKYLGQLYEQQQ